MSNDNSEEVKTLIADIIKMITWQDPYVEEAIRGWRTKYSDADVIQKLQPFYKETTERSEFYNTFG